MYLKKKMEAPKHLKPLDQQPNMVSIQGDEYQKLDTNSRAGVRTYLASKANHNLLKRNMQRETL
jgi:hypothetical protein